MPSTSQSGEKLTRTSYPLEKKLSAIAKFESGQSMRSIGKEIGANECVVRRGVREKDKLKSSVGTRNVNVRKTRKIGCGKKAAFPELELRLIKWIHDRNSRGLRVKDKFIHARAIMLKAEMIAELTLTDTDEARIEIKAHEEFLFSSSWCTRFKDRHQLVSRRHTTARTLPENFQDIARDFISDVQNLIMAHGITPNRIVNFDQVPRYFETANNSTIITRGTKEVLLRKASTSHKRFTFTPAINAAGDIVALHLLFSNLKNVPKVQAGCIVDVNKTGMWNDLVLTRTIAHIVKACQTPFREPLLILLDSYGTHIKFVEQKSASYERKNIFFRIIPAKLTGLWQPLDVAVNRGFQQHYNDLYNKHLTAGLNNDDPATKTKVGNVKMPTYFEISEWINDWARSQTPAAISKAFDLCGLVSPTNFDVEKLHKPLRECYSGDFSLVRWEENFLNDVGNSNEPEEDADCYLFDEKFSFFKAFYEARNERTVEYKQWLQITITEVQDFIRDSHILSPFFLDEDKLQFRSGKLTDSHVEILALANLQKLQISITEVDESWVAVERKKYGELDAEKSIEMISFSQIFGCKKQPKE